MHSKLDSSTETAREIGAEVRRQRQALGLRQDELALAAGVSTRVVHQIESAKPTSRLDSVAPVLAVLGLRLRVELPRGAAEASRGA